LIASAPGAAARLAVPVASVHHECTRSRPRAQAEAMRAELRTV
jgi:hypothetical protein